MNMKNLILTIIGLILILLASYAVISYESNPYTLKTFVVGGDAENVKTNYNHMKTFVVGGRDVKINHNNIKTFVVGQKPSGKSELIGLKKDSKCARERNLRYQRTEEEIDRCIKKITKNWKRTYFKRSSEKIYDDEEKKWEHVEVSPYWEKDYTVFGYDEDEDKDLRWKLKEKFLNGEKMC